jgi:hypothetical protein
MKKHYAMGLAATVLTLASLTLPAYADTPDTSANSMMSGGCFSQSECMNKLQNGDGVHSAAELQSVYGAEGISINTFQSGDIVEGTVTSSGDVIVGGKTVATGAQSFGRDFVAGSTKVGALFERPTSAVFLQSQLEAFVIMHKGVFQRAVLKSCGNVVVANAIAVTVAKPAPKVVTKVVTKTVKTPAPTVNVVQSQSQVQIQSQTQTTPTVTTAATPTVTTPTPAAATAIPDTGAASAAGLTGLSAMFIVAWYWLRSRRGLRFALKQPPSNG